MKIQMQSKNTQQTLLRYRYIKVANPDVPGAEGREGVNLFLYIGTNVEHFDSLRRELGNGWMVADIDEAKLSLKSLRREACIITAVFVDDATALTRGTSAIRQLKSNIILQEAVFIGNFRGLGSDEVACLRKNPVFDELVDFRVETALLVEKIDMLRRVRFALKERERQVRLETSPSQVYNRYYLGKRFIDIVCASLLLIVLMPVFLLIALAIKIESRGPILYNSYRAGRGYRIFKFFKFRTMKVGADRMIQSIAHLNKYNNFGHAPVFFKADNDPRITRVGQFLRNSGLDELPQLFNVLIGDMSIVGNRPLPLYEASALTNNEWAERFSAPAGITGLWQVTCRSDGNFTTADRICRDLDYARTHNFVTDMTILAKTPVVLFKGLVLDRGEREYSAPLPSPRFKPEFSQF
jgi:lipopolysaccharide/colanic/teichoic acid biosynthesis glycosyltransferase